MLSYAVYVFFFKQKTAYEMRISDWSSDVCSSDLRDRRHARSAVGRHRDGTAIPAVAAAVPADVARQPHRRAPFRQRAAARLADDGRGGTGRRRGFGGGADIELISFSVRVEPIGRAACRERGCQYV